MEDYSSETLFRLVILRTTNTFEPPILISRFDRIHQKYSLRTDKYYGEYADVNDIDEMWDVPNEVSNCRTKYSCGNNQKKTEKYSKNNKKYNRNKILWIKININNKNSSLFCVLQNIMANSSLEYKLPYKIKPLVKPYDAKSYAFGCIYEFFRITMVISGYIGTDCLLASTGFHLTGQLAILKFRVKDVLNDTDGSRRGIHKLIIRHHHLIKLADILEDSFNIVICQQLLGTTIQICISSYQMLTSLAVLEGVGIITFVIYVSILSGTLFTYCYIGECLIEESTNLCDALYHCDWYELSMIDVKSIYICMIRARKPLRLTCAKFCVVSLRTFADIMKTSMAYLSVLRTFM
ncbi:odorant receptor 13a-like [Vespula maculifrons]|uniref:Odorant receptor n=1 Tax=Vespula maculifrons TaxID=7453 RepID=A0ABD2BPR3_VESMC